MSLLLWPLRLAFLLICSPALLVWPWICKVFLGLRPSPVGIPPCPQTQTPAPPGDLSVLIVSLDGRTLLEDCLPALARELDTVQGNHQVIVVDNGSSDGTAEWLAREWPNVEVLEFDRNHGFGGGNNLGLERVVNPHVLLLNNDMILEAGFFQPLMRGFVDGGVFAVSAQVFSPAGQRREETGRTRALLRRGRLEFYHDPCDDKDALRPILWAGGGASLYATDKFKELGGFDPVFSPAYVEDTDLAWRAWKRGWRSLLATKARVLHKHRSTSSRVFSARALKALIRGNQWIFQLRNLSDETTISSTLRWLPFQISIDILDEGILITVLAWARVIQRAGAIRKGHQRDSLENRIPDEELLSMDRRFVQPEARQGKPHVLMIAAFVPRFGVHAGGQRMFHLITRLSTRFRISVLAYAETSEEANSAVHLERYCQEVKTIIRGQSPTEPNPFFRTPPWIAGEYANPEMRREIEIRLSSGDYDLIQFEYLQMAYLLPPHCSIPRILTNHEVQSFALRKRMQASTGFARLKDFGGWMLNLRFERRTCRRFDRVITMTDIDAAELLAYDESLPVVVNNTGVDTRTLVPAPEPQNNKICFVGYYRHYPNVEAMLRLAKRILPLVKQEIPDISLSIIGAQPSKELLDLCVDPAIEVTGRVESISPCVHAAKLFIVPLSAGVGIRGKVLEAWALGRAVVSTNLGVAGLRYEDGKHLLIADSDKEIAQAIIRLLTDEPLRREIVRQALARVRHEYSWESKAEEHELIWREVLQLCGSRCADSPWRLFSTMKHKSPREARERVG